MTLTFDSWLTTWTPIVGNLQEYIKTSSPTEYGPIAAEIEKLSNEIRIVADLVADADDFIRLTRAQETTEVIYNPKFADWSAAERKVQVEARISGIIAYKDHLKVLLNALESRQGAALHNRKQLEEIMSMGRIKK